MNHQRINKINLFITGATGFIGQNLVEYLKEKPEFTLFCPSHKELELLETEKVAQFIKNNKIDIIVNLANVGGSRKTAYDQGQTDIVYQNLRIFFNLARCLGQVKLMINIGSGAEYDRRHWQRGMGEDYFDVHVPEDAYGFSKYVCAKYTQQSSKIISLRLFGVFGKHEDYTIKFISNAILKKLFGLPIVIYQNVYFDYLYIDDLVKIIELFIRRRPKGKIYNVATGQRVSLLGLARQINRLPGKPTKIIIENPGLNTEYTANNTKLMAQFPDFAFTPLEKSLEDLYRWYRQGLDLIDPKTLIADRYHRYAKIKR